MIISILFLLIILIITLDSFGSKRLRRRVIKQSKAFFETSKVFDPSRSTPPEWPELLHRFLEFSKGSAATPIQTIRFKLKGAQKKEKAKNWQPIEAKQFQTLQPLSMTYYEDRTLGFLWSIKKYRLIQNKKTSIQQWMLSLFPYHRKQAKENQWLNWIHLLASLPWVPDLVFLNDLHWQKDDKQKNGLVATLHRGGRAIRAYYTFKPNGQIIACHCQLDEVLGVTSDLKLSYQYSGFEQVENWKVPLRIEIKKKDQKSVFYSRFQITQVVYNEDFAWW